jgi:hypothetical protein
MPEAPRGPKSAELVYRLLTVPMDYSTFATVSQASPDQGVEDDINLEYSTCYPRVLGPTPYANQL